MTPGLQILPSAYGLGQHFQDLGHGFFPIRTEPKPADNIFIFFFKTTEVLDQLNLFNYKAMFKYKMNIISRNYLLVTCIFSLIKNPRYVLQEFSDIHLFLSPTW